MKKILPALWEELVYGGHLVGLCVVSVVWCFALLSNNPFNWQFALLVYCGMRSCYLFNWITEKDGEKGANSKRAGYSGKNRRSFFLQIIISVLVIIALLYRHAAACYLGLALLGLGFLYTVYLKKLTTIIPGFKNLFIPVPVVLLIVLYGLYYGLPFTPVFWFMGAFIFIRTFMSGVFCDIKDIAEDSQKGLKTFAVLLGEKKVLTFLQTLNFLTLFTVLPAIHFGFFPLFSLGLLLVVPYFYLPVFLLKKTGDRALLSYTLSDGEMVLWFPFTLLGWLAAKISG